jgi:hypothetical protein
MSTASFRAIVVMSDGSSEDKSPRNLLDVHRMAKCFGCGVTDIVGSDILRPGVYSFVIPPMARPSSASDADYPERGFLAWLSEAIDPRTSPIRYAEILFDGDHGTAVVERHSADGVRVDALAALNIPRG